MLSRFAHNATPFHHLHKTLPRALSYYNSDNTNNSETVANNTHIASAVNATVKAEPATVKAEPATVIATDKAETVEQLEAIENKIDWIIVFTVPTWIYTIGTSIHKLLC